MGAQAFIPRSLAEHKSDSPPRSRVTEACALLLFAVAVFVTLALLSVRVHPEDPAYAGEDWMGAVGAAIAGVLARGFGMAAWLVPVELVFIGAPLLRGRRPQLVGLRIAGDLVLLVLAASLLQVALPRTECFGYAAAGGNVGLFFGELMRGLFSAPGSFLVGLTGIGLLLIGRSSFSFIGFCQWTLEKLEQLQLLLVRGWERAREIWRDASLLRRERVRAEKRAPVIERTDPEAAIVHHLEDCAPWVPLESTGVPPLALAESLRRSFPAALEEDGLDGAHSDLGDADSPHDSAGPDGRDGGLTRALVDDLDGFWSSQSDAPEGFEQPEEPEPLEELAPEPAPPASDLAPTADAATSDSLAAPSTPDSAAIPEPKIVDTSNAQRTRAARKERARRGDGFELPDTELLSETSDTDVTIDREAVLRQADLLEKTLADYGVTGKVEEIHPGPTVTTFEVAPAAGTKVSKVAGLSDDLALGLSRKVRIIAPIPGKSRIGFELPNDERIPVNLRELVEDERFQKLSKKAPLPVVLGRDIVGAPFYADLASMPHVIVAGATGAGKSVGLNVMLSSLLFKRTPEELRLLMIDPKVVELAPFDRIPHLLLPVVTDMKQAAQALKWAVDEMERRYQLFADAGTKNISTYNRYTERVRAGEIAPPRVQEVEATDHNGDMVMVPCSKKGSDGVELPDKLPYIVVVVDEFADLMMQQGKEVEASVARLAQKARAAGMHVILATQRPSVDVITGMIKANFPSRIAYRVAQKVDSRTILDEQGAEVLLGKGDMLVKLNGATDTLRVQCPFVSEEEVSDLTDHLRRQGEPQYQDSILEDPEADEADEGEEKVDSRFEEAVLIVRDTQRCSTSWLQRKMTIGYNRAAKIVETMERRGYIGPPNGSRDREVMLPPG